MGSNPENQKCFEKLFPDDVLTKRQRVENTLNLRPVDRVAIHDQMSYNPKVIAFYTGKDIHGFDYTWEDVALVIKKTLDMCFPPISPRGTDRAIDEDGFITQHDNWTSWHVSRPFSDEDGAKEWLKKKIDKLINTPFNAKKERQKYREYILGIQQKVGDTVICDYSTTGLCSVYDNMGLELFSYFYADDPKVMTEFMEVSVARELQRIHAIADQELSPVILIPEDFATKQGPIFSPDFLDKQHYPYVKRLVEAWHNYGFKVIYHSDGNYKKAIPDLIACGVDGFYCLEPNCGMDIVELKQRWPQMVWAGGVDGVDLMERGTPRDVRQEIRRHILETDALNTGGMFVASSSEINPPIPVENFKAMLDAVGELKNNDVITKFK